MIQNQSLGRHLCLEEFCTCIQTYRKYADRINPYPKNLNETLPALQAIAQHILDPSIDHFGKERFELTYGFCSIDLRRYLAQKDPETGMKNGQVDPSRDQYMAHEVNRNGKYYCARLGAACDFRIIGLESDRLVEWILEQRLPFDSLYYYGSDRPIHTSYGSQHKQVVWFGVLRERSTDKARCNFWLVSFLRKFALDSDLHVATTFCVGDVGYSSFAANVDPKFESDFTNFRKRDVLECAQGVGGVCPDSRFDGISVTA